MSSQELCMCCMSVKGNVSICPNCKLDEKRLNVSPLSLPLRTILNNQFLVGRVLGKPGGFGITYLGWDLMLELRVAIKEFLPREFAGRNTDRKTVTPYSEEDNKAFMFGLKQFLQEARTLAKFNHSNIVRIRTFFEQNNTAYLVMDYYEGFSLQGYLMQKSGILPEKPAIDIMLPLLDGLHEVHTKGFLHRDIKPQNIYLTKNGIPILLDFGSSRFAMGERSRSLSVILTQGYAPYEQYHRKGHQGPWTDIYACGATLYTMLTGKVPPEAIEREKDDTLEPPDKVVPTLSPMVSKAILKALETEAANRPQTVIEFRDMLSSQPKSPLVEIIQPVEIKTKSKKPKHLHEFQNSIGMKFVFLKSDTFTIGSPIKEFERYPDEVQHLVTLSNGFYIQTTQVTQAHWKLVMGNNPSKFKNDGNDYPVENLTWYDAVMFCNQLSEIENRNQMYDIDIQEEEDGHIIDAEVTLIGDVNGYRLPTESEWEYAARANTKTPFSFGDCLSTDQGNFNGNFPYTGCSSGLYREKTVPVGTLGKNAWGLYDMHGNVWEWCHDWYGDYPEEHIIDPMGSQTGTERVLRGGSWNSNAKLCRSSYRFWLRPSDNFSNLGFRIILSSAEVQQISKQKCISVLSNTFRA